jgi:hypothetical protein
MLSTPARPFAPRFVAAEPFPTQASPRHALGSSWISSRYFTLVALTLALPFICLAGRPLFGDVWWILANGRALVQQGQLLQADPFTFAPHTAVYFDAQWLSQLLYYWAYQVAGFEGVSVFNASVATLTFGLLLRVAWHRSRNMAAATVSVLCAELTALWYIHPRAQTLAFAAFAATVCLVVCARPRARVVLGLAAIEALWANLHGSFFMGPLFVGLLLGGEIIEQTMAGQWRSVMRNTRARYLALVIAAQLVGTLATPYGLNLYSYLLKFSVDPIIRDHISEWMPTAATDWPGVEFFASVGLTLAILGFARRRFTAADVLILGLFAALGIEANRNIPWWGLATSPVLAAALASLKVPNGLTRIGQSFITSKRQVRGNLMRGALLTIVLVVALPWTRAVNPWLPASQRTMLAVEYPVAATNFLATHPVGSRIFGEHPWGSYIDWWLFPRYQAMIDPAVEVHPVQVWLDVLTIEQGHVSWEDLINKYGVDVLMLRRETQGLLIDAVERSPRWHSVYEDEQTVIYTPSAEANVEVSW